MTAPTSRQPITKIRDADYGTTSSEADINRISRSRADSSSRGEMWCSFHKTTTHNNANCRATPANGLDGNAHFAQVRPPSVPGICSSWVVPVRDDPDEKPCISFLARGVQPSAKPAKARVEEKGARPCGPVLTAATERWRTRPWPFTPRAEPQPVTKPAKARVEAKGARPFGSVSTAATEGWRTRPWLFTPRAEQAISFGGSVAKEKFGMANDEEPVENALMASSSVAVTSEDSANSNLATLMEPVESLPGEVRGPLSGGASTPLSGRASTPSGVKANDEEPVEKALLASSSVAVTSEDSANSNLAILIAPADSLPGEIRELLSGSINAFVRGSINALVRGKINAFVRGSINALVRGKINAFVRGSINAEWRESVARNSATFAGSRAGCSKNGGRYTQQHDPSVQRRHAACCRGADGRGNPLQGSTPQQK